VAKPEWFRCWWHGMCIAIRTTLWLYALLLYLDVDVVLLMNAHCSRTIARQHPPRLAAADDTNNKEAAIPALPPLSLAGLACTNGSTSALGATL
jgi:hypothetical protein